MGPVRRAHRRFRPDRPGYLHTEVKRLLALCGISASLAVTGATDTQSARQPTLLTYAVESSGSLCLARADGSRRVRLTPGKDRAPSWSPGGRYVVFSRQVGTASRIFV